MKVALVGNMNNNNFAILRYFRDSGVDAHLLLFANDGQQSLSHFRPESDTWSIEKWQPYIHQTAVQNGEFTIVGRNEAQLPVGVPIAIAKSLLRRLAGKSKMGWRAPAAAMLESNLGGYDRYIGAGITPAIFERMGKRLDIFYPYSTGIEFYSSPEFMVKLKSPNRWLRLAAGRVRQYQAEGIRNARVRLNAELGDTQRAFEEIGAGFEPLAIPMVYVEPPPPAGSMGPALDAVIDSMKAQEMSLLSTSRLFWRRPASYDEGDWRIENKNSQRLFEGFAEFLKRRPGIKARLYVIEYGPHVEETKALAAELGVASHVQWLPKMRRKDILQLLASVTVACGEFPDYPKALWGGTGWEALATGRPLLQAFTFNPGEYESLYGHPPPPLLPVRNSADVTAHLQRMTDDPQARHDLGRSAREWFERYNGPGLAKLWARLLLDSAAGSRN